jgi:hypothetical protein
MALAQNGRICGSYPPDSTKFLMHFLWLTMLNIGGYLMQQKGRSRRGAALLQCLSKAS